MPVVDIWFAPGVREEHDWLPLRSEALNLIAEKLDRRPAHVTLRYHDHDDWNENVHPLDIDVRLDSHSIGPIMIPTHGPIPTLNELLNRYADGLHAALAPLVPFELDFEVWIFAAAGTGYKLGRGGIPPTCEGCKRKMEPAGGAFVCTSCGNTIFG